MISLVVARSQNNVIGRDGQIPWHFPDDLKFFRKETLGGAVIMGRRTWESLNSRALPNRFNIVVTSAALETPEGVIVVTSVQKAIDAAKAAGHARIYGIGGNGIYREMLALAHRLLITEMALTVPDGDTYFPDFDSTEWHELQRYTVGDTFASEYCRK